MTRTFIIAAVAALAALTGVIAGCGHHCSRNATPERRAEYAVKMISRELDLNETQRARLGEIKSQVLAKFREIKAEKAGMRDEVMAMVKSPALTRDQLNRIADKHEEGIRRLKPFIIDKVVEFHGMLNQEQKNKLAELMEKFHKRHGEG